MAGSGGVAAGAIGDFGTSPAVPFSVERAAFAQSVAVPPDIIGGEYLRGRGRVVQELLDSFEGAGDGGRSLLLHGLGGSGKTSIAAAVGRKLSAKGVDVWWVSAVDHARLVAGIHAVGRLIGASTEELQADDAAEAVWRRLNAQTQPWLLVVDNADDPEGFDVTADGAGWADGWIRPVLNQTGLVLVTSRRGGGRTHAGPRLRQIPVDMLNPADGAQVLLDLTHGRGGDHKAACALSERLGGLPLALTVAGLYLARSVDDLSVDDGAVITFQDFHAALDRGRADLMDTAPQDPAGGTALVVDEVWRMAVRLLERRGLSLAARFMRLLAHFAAAPLPYRDILRQRALFDSPVFAELDREQAGTLLHESANLGLLTLTAAALDPDDTAVPVLRLHPLMRDASHRYHDPVHGDDAYLTTAARLLVDSAAGEPDWSPKDHTRWNFWTLLAPHAFHLLPALARTEIDPTLVDRVAHTVDLAARHLYVRGMRAQAEAEYQSMLRTCRHTLGSEHERTLAARHGIALVFEGKGDLAGAEAEFQAVLGLRRRVLGEEHPDTLTTRHNLAGVLQDRGDLAGAEAEFQAVLGIERRVLGEEHPDTLVTRNNLAGVLRDRGDLAGAEAELQAVLGIERRVLGEEHPDTLTTRNNLAGVLRNRGDLAGAEAELQAVLGLRRRVLGEEHPSTLTTRNNLAGALRDRGDLAGAEAELQAVLGIERRVLGEEHRDTLVTRNNLAGVLRNRGDLAGAEAELQAVLGLRRRVLGEEHPSTLTTRNNLAGALQDRGDLAGAEAELQAVLGIERRVLGEEHPDTLTTRNNLAGVLRNRGDLAGAEAELQAVLGIERRLLGEEHPDTLVTRNNLAGALQDRGDLAGAEAELQAVLDIARRVLGEEHPSTLTTQHNLAIVCAIAGRYRESDTTMRAVLAARQRVLGENHPTTQATKEALRNIRHNAAKAKQPILWHGPGKRRKKGKKR
ncbi:tetratricopeptide repeat protein [Amycolatopsis roodepoortensis]|uniref:tetratricopeptide repeat protein n=1 Tax=Amycolatopsis roodepoortensis TaxID=700274 RepID=UPI00214A8FBA|nr:tetratricopeptide repeat protein [Amycolatopsis roodepoortensis]UUV32954.1 tetratricopeptide repeat protein [Amycolatopsis roodepoortensis]